MGIMRRDAIRSIGGFDESVRRGEDWEMNFRLREAGHLVWLDPRLKVSYWPRDNWRNLARQFDSTGVWRGEIIRRHKGRNPLRFFAPPVLVVNLAVAIVVGLLQARASSPARSRGCLSAVYPGPVAYVLLLLFAAATTSGTAAGSAAVRRRPGHDAPVLGRRLPPRRPARGSGEPRPLAALVARVAR